MEKLKLRYHPDDRPPWPELLLFGLQWLVVGMTSVIVTGKVVAGLHFDEPALQVLYLQKLFFVVGFTQLLQIFFGHRLPLVTGPATVLIVGILAGMGRNIDTIYTAIAAGGVLLWLLNLTGLFARISRLFTVRVVAAVLMLIALTITPVIVRLITAAPSPHLILPQIGCALVLLLCMLAADRLLKGAWKATMLLWAMVGGSVLVSLVFPPVAWQTHSGGSMISHCFKELTLSPGWDPGLLIAFCICFMALAINDLGSVQAVGKLVKAQDMDRRISSSINMTGLANALAGFFGVIGSVSFSMSTGLIASNGNASRFTLIPAGLGLVCIAFLPDIAAFVWNVPGVVVGTALLYIMSAQLTAGLMVAFSTTRFSFQDGMIIAVPAMVSVVIAYLPPGAQEAMPRLLAPIVGNGFVMGVLTVLILEHVLYRPARPDRGQPGP
ncbi:MAG: uracil-xanthine permease family protein [Desulfobulbus sp.]|jgi:xanthine/uracil permease